MDSKDRILAPLSSSLVERLHIALENDASAATSKRLLNELGPALSAELGMSAEQITEELQ